MVSVLKNNNNNNNNNSEGETQEVKVSANLQKTIQSIKDFVGGFSDSEIYNHLMDNNMDPNEAAQKLLNQDPFHEVRRRRDKKKENAVYNGPVEPRKRADYVGQGTKFYGADRNGRRGGYTRSATNGISREFRVVRDNRVNQNSDKETKTSTQTSSSSNVHHSNASDKSSYAASNNQRHSAGRYVQTLSGVTDFRPKVARENHFHARKELLDDRRFVVSGSASQDSAVKASDSHGQSQLGSSASSSAVGVYASASDPVHVPSPDSRSSAAIGAIRREVGVVGARRQSSESISKQSFQQSSSSNLNPVLGGSSTSESFRPVNSFSRNEQSHAPVMESAMISSSASRLGNHFSNRLHQQAVGHQKGLLPSKEWKPKTSQKSTVSNPGVIGSPVKSASKPADTSENAGKETDQLEDKLSQVNIHESQNVIIAQHIRVPENDRCRLTFGSFGMESDGVDNTDSTFQAPQSVEETHEPSPSQQQMNAVDDQVRDSGSSSPSSGDASENQLPEEKNSSDVPVTESYADMNVASNGPSFAGLKAQEHQDSTELPNFSAYDPQPVYDMPYFRPSVDDAVRGPGLPSPQEALSPHTANSIPASSVPMMQQQAPMAQMYPQMHLSHFANVMPYRQFIPPMYVPPMVPGYSGNPGYPHLSNGSTYVLMPGGTSHLPANNLKYGVQQFKPLPAGSPTGFGNFANPSGYSMNAPGVVGGPTGLDESSRLKYKDNNLYVPNPQAETSEVWLQNHREISGMQSTPYFNMQGQTTHPAYLQSHNSHASFNAAVAQSSHMQFPGMYPPQQGSIPNAHHLGAGNIGVGMGPAAPGAQVGAYQQPQISHLSWTTNF